MGGSFNSSHFHGTSGSPQRALELDSAKGARTDSDRGETIPPSHHLTTRDALLSEATTDKARFIINELYRETGSIGDGGTADAIRYELATGELVGDKGHLKKGRQRIRQIEKVLRRNPNHPDRELLTRLANDLRNALRGI